jgi:hypothetical protein
VQQTAETDFAALSGLLTEAEAAAYLRVRPRTLQDWRVRAVGPRFVRYSGRGVRYRMADLGAWLASKERTSTTDRGAA